jgi:hypothetical protein
MVTSLWVLIELEVQLLPTFMINWYRIVLLTAVNLCSAVHLKYMKGKNCLFPARVRAIGYYEGSWNCSKFEGIVVVLSHTMWLGYEEFMSL